MKTVHIHATDSDSMKKMFEFNSSEIMDHIVKHSMPKPKTELEEVRDFTKHDKDTLELFGMRNGVRFPIFSTTISQLRKSGFDNHFTLFYAGAKPKIDESLTVDVDHRNTPPIRSETLKVMVVFETEYRKK